MRNTNLLFKVIEILNLAVEMGVGLNPGDLANNRKTSKKHNKRSLITSRLKRYIFNQILCGWYTVFI